MDHKHDIFLSAHHVTLYTVFLHCRYTSNWFKYSCLLSFPLQSLIFLFPLKKLQRDLISQLEQENVSAAAVYKWMKVSQYLYWCITILGTQTNVDPSLYHTPEFIILLTQW